MRPAVAHRASIRFLQYAILLSAYLVPARAQSPASSRPSHSTQPHPAPRQIPVSIVPTTQPEDSSSIDIGSDHWIALGYDLRALIAEIYAADLLRIDLPANADPARYDVSLKFPEETTEEQVHHFLQQALRDKFRIVISREARTTDVYVITSPHGPGPALHPHRSTVSTRTSSAAAKNASFSPGSSGDLELAPEDMQRFTIQGRICPGISSGGISATAGTISEFRRVFEPTLDRPLVNESNLPGSYDFQIAQYSSREELFQLLSDQLGLVLTPSQRQITVLAVRSAEAPSPQAGDL